MKKNKVQWTIFLAYFQYCTFILEIFREDQLVLQLIFPLLVKTDDTKEEDLVIYPEEEQGTIIFKIFRYFCTLFQEIIREGILASLSIFRSGLGQPKFQPKIFWANVGLGQVDRKFNRKCI